MASFTPSNVELKEKTKIEKTLKEQLEKEREQRLQEDITKTEIERNKKQGIKLLQNHN
jgi:hypothetical protein